MLEFSPTLPWSHFTTVAFMSDTHLDPTLAACAPQISIVRVFTDADGRYGNGLGVLAHVPGVTAEQMIALTRRLGLSETVLLGPGPDAPVRIFNPVEELSFAGHPMVGVTWLRGRDDPLVGAVHCAAGRCNVAVNDGVAWVTAPTAWAPPWDSVRYDTAAEVEALTGPPEGHDFVQTWAWIDESSGRVRARVFAPKVDIPEDEACGSASILLADRLRREIVIEHGRGSVVHARSVEPGIAQVGGRVVLDEVRRENLPGG
jgi:predicted PhzF superfamily epimerase YddE/YHI9